MWPNSNQVHRRQNCSPNIMIHHILSDVCHLVPLEPSKHKSQQLLFAVQYAASSEQNQDRISEAQAFKTSKLLQNVLDFNHYWILPLLSMWLSEQLQRKGKYQLIDLSHYKLTCYSNKIQVASLTTLAAATVAEYCGHYPYDVALQK